LMAETRKPFAETWALLGASVELAANLVDADSSELVSLLMAARKGGNGTASEYALVSAFAAMRAGAVAQIELADKAIAMVEAVTKYADESALAELSAGAAH
jgi:hypothetical protein